MKIGLHLCEQLIGFDPGVIRDYAVLADELGFDHITCVDHVLGTEHADRNPPFEADGIYTEDSVFHEPLTLFSFRAAVTSRIEFCTSVLVLAAATDRIARQADGGDRPSLRPPAPTRCRQRLELGRVRGPGWRLPHARPHAGGAGPAPPAALDARRFVDVDTDLHRIDRAGINPRLDRPVPIWFGGFSKVQMDRCARIGDGIPVVAGQLVRPQKQRVHPATGSRGWS